MGGTCSTRGRDDKYIGLHNFIGEPEVKGPAGIPRHRLCGKMILKCILKKWSVRMWTGLIWLRIETIDGPYGHSPVARFYKHDNEVLDFMKV